MCQLKSLLDFIMLSHFENDERSRPGCRLWFKKSKLATGKGKTVKMLAVLQCIRCGVNRNRTIVTPAQAGVQQKKPWIPACAEPAPVKAGERRRGKQERC